MSEIPYLPDVPTLPPRVVGAEDVKFSFKGTQVGITSNELMELSKIIPKGKNFNSLTREEKHRYLLKAHENANRKIDNSMQRELSKIVEDETNKFYKNPGRSVESNIGKLNTGQTVNSLIKEEARRRFKKDTIESLPPPPTNPITTIKSEKELDKALGNIDFEKIDFEKGGKKKTKKRKKTKKIKKRKTRSKKQKGGEEDMDYKLFLASQNGKADVVLDLLESGVANVNYNHKNSGVTPLYVASQNGHIQVLDILLYYNAKINQARNDGTTPLWIASYMGHVDVVTMLLDSEANINQAENNGQTPLYAASGKGHMDVVRVLLDREADIKQETNIGETPLFAASLFGHEDVVKVLLDRGADIYHATHDGHTPLYTASARGYEDIVRLLAQRGPADINKAKDTGKTPLFIASQQGYVKVVKELLERDADMNKAENDGETPLHIASGMGHVDVVRILVKNGDDINKVNNNGATPLYIASMMGRVQVVRALLMMGGADINKATNEGITPLNMASYKGHVEVVKVLIEKGAIPEMTKEEFKTCAESNENNEDKIICGITFEELNEKNAVKPEVEKVLDPSGNVINVINNQCFERSALQTWLKNGNRTHPLTRQEITDEWINKWYPLGLDEDYNVLTGGKRKTRKSKKSKKIKKKKTNPFKKTWRCSTRSGRNC